MATGDGGDDRTVGVTLVTSSVGSRLGIVGTMCQCARVVRPRRDALDTPHPSRWGPDHPGYRAALDAHAEALRAGEPGYLDPASGLFVMTAMYLLDRGYCCDQRCRHCPWITDDAET